MSDKEILTGIRKYFHITELVGAKTYGKFGGDSWQFLDIRLLHALLIVREGIGKEITINNYGYGGYFQQRGLRTNVQEICKHYYSKNKLYLSAHVLGKAVDFDVKGMLASDVRKWIIDNSDLFPFKIRLEKNITWTHLDVIQHNNKNKVYLFQG